MTVSLELQKEICKFVEAWQKIGEMYDKIDGLFKVSPDAPFFQSVFQMAELYIKSLDDRIRRGDEWLSWFIFENQCGEKELKAGKGEDMVPVRDLNDFFKLLDLL